MKNVLALVLAAVLSLGLTGCFSPSVPAVANWTIAPVGSEKPETATPAFGPVRLAMISVRAPYDVRTLAVLRPDGSIAFDHYNQFAAAPSALVKGAALDALAASGRFAAVLPVLSAAKTEAELELELEELALDCRRPGPAQATVRLALTLVQNHQALAFAAGTGAVAVKADDYSRAFGAALAAAVNQAAGALVK